MFEKVLPDRESNPGLPRDRRGYSPLYYRGLNAASISHHVDRSMKIKRGLLTAWKCGGVRRRRAVKAFITGLLHNLETTSKMRWLRNLSKLNQCGLALGFLHSRTNLSPFTKDFRGGDQFDEYLTIFLRSGFGQTDNYQ